LAPSRVFSDRAGDGAGRGGRGAEYRQQAQSRQPVADPAPGQDPGNHREERQHDVNPGQQHGFVVAAEMHDREILDRNGSQVDGRAADRDHGFSCDPGKASHQLGHAERGRRGQQADEAAHHDGAEGSPRALREFLHHHEAIRPRGDRRLDEVNKSWHFEAL
jgi:hypothetical protein